MANSRISEQRRLVRVAKAQYDYAKKYGTAAEKKHYAKQLKVTVSALRAAMRANPLRSGRQFRLAEAVAHGTARYPTTMSKRVAREMIAKTPRHLRSKLARENPNMIPAKVIVDEKTGKVRVFVNPRHLKPKDQMFPDARFTKIGPARKFAKAVGGKVVKLPGYGYAVVAK